MPPTTDADAELRELRDLLVGLREEVQVGAVTTDNKISAAVTNTDAKIMALQQEIRDGFAEMKVANQKLDNKIDVKFSQLQAQIDVLNERTKLGFWGFTGRAVIIGIIGLLAKFLFRSRSNQDRMTSLKSPHSNFTIVSH
jgi:hypothetical protein